ncbi:MAG: glycosyltransferase [Betaproteobacteria bacterium]
MSAAFPDHPLLLRAQARHCLYFGRFRRALRLLDRLAAQGPGDPGIETEADQARDGLAKLAQLPRYKFSMVVLTYGNHADILEACLAGIRRRCRLPPAQVEIIVGINGSTDGSEAIAAAHGARVVRRDRNEDLDLYKPLFAMAQGEYLVDVDDDVIDFPDGFDVGLLDRFAAFPDYAFLGLSAINNEFVGRRMPPDDRYAPDQRGDLCVWEGPVGGWCAAISRRDYFGINGFNGVRLSDENGKLLVGEEPQIWKKLSERGRRFGVLPELRCVHGVKSMAAWNAWLAAQEG